MERINQWKVTDTKDPFVLLVKPLLASWRPLNVLLKTLWDRKGSWVVGYRRRWLYICYSGRIAHICAEMGK